MMSRSSHQRLLSQPNQRQVKPRMTPRKPSTDEVEEKKQMDVDHGDAPKASTSDAVLSPSTSSDVAGTLSDSVSSEISASSHERIEKDLERKLLRKIQQNLLLIWKLFEKGKEASSPSSSVNNTSAASTSSATSQHSFNARNSTETVEPQTPSKTDATPFEQRSPEQQT